MTTPFRLTFGMAGALFAALAGAAVTELRWDAQGRFEYAAEVAPGKFAELCGPLPAGAKVQWQFEAGAALDFNIHYHQGREVHYPAKEPGRAASNGVLETQHAQDYCWMWTNRHTAPVTLRATLHKS